MKIHSHDTLTRVLRDLVSDELGRLRHTDPTTIAQALNDDERLGPDGFGMDSFEFMTISAMVGRMFHLYDLGAEDYLLSRPTVTGWRNLILKLSETDADTGADAGTSLAGPAHHVSFLSSGSTGERTPVEHSRPLLVEEMQFFQNLLGAPSRIFVTVPTHHIYGYLFGALLPDLYFGVHDDALDVAERRIVPLRGPALSRPRTAYRRSGTPAPGTGDLLIAFPDALARLLQAGVLPCPGLTVVTSTAPCPPELASRIRAGGSRLVEVYGSSETSGIGFRDADDSPYTLLPYWNRDGDALWRSTGQETRGGTPDLRVELPDWVEWFDDSTFLPLRRRDGAVMVGGRNVFPRSVESVIREIDGVAEVAVRLDATDDGARLKAFVVPVIAGDTDSQSYHTLETRIRSTLSGRLQSAEQPAVYTFGPALPRNSMGKLSDWDS